MIELPKNTRETMRVRLREYKGQRYLDARLYFRKDEGEMQHNRQGVTVSLDRADDLGHTIEQVARQEQFDAD